jgi:stage II sporulation protein D
VNRAALVAVLLVTACLTGKASERAKTGEGVAAPEAAPQAEPVSGVDAAVVGAGNAGTAPDAAGPPHPDLPPLTQGEGGDPGMASQSPSPTAPDPLPPPAPPPPFADLSDPLELLWGHRLEFAGGGEPLVAIRLMEGQREIVFRARGSARVLLRGGAVVEVPAGARLRVRARDAVPAVIAWHALLAEAPVAGRARLDEARRFYAARGVPVTTRLVGGVFGIAGRVIDGRRELLLAESDGTEAGARRVMEDLRARTGARPSLHSEVVGRPGGRLVLLGEGGAPLGEADAAITVLVDRDLGFVVEGVEHERGPAARAREDRAYVGRLYVTLDASGALAAVHGVPLEELLRGLVPSEMPASSPQEALRAQAVTARSNVLAQIGARHLTDPFMLCAEVHCQAYRGDGARTARTDEAVLATRGEALFGKADRTLVDAVYSATCGGHGEDNDQVWGNVPSPSLRGRPDLPPDDARRWPSGLADETRLRPFLADAGRAWCRRSPAAPNYRWERRFSPAELDLLAAPLGVGHVRALEVRARGVSGRARLLAVIGDRGEAEVAGELRIRRLLRNLPSAMFVVDRAGDALVLRGGGWGHGAGMCQWGAVGRAAAGQGYREILRAYYSGAEVARVYGDPAEPPSRAQAE